MTRRTANLTIAILAALCAVVLAWAAYGQQRTPGVGHPTPSRASWETQSSRRLADFRLNSDARPWGNRPPRCADAGLDVPDLVAYYQRFAAAPERVASAAALPATAAAGTCLWANAEQQKWCRDGEAWVLRGGIETLKPVDAGGVGGRGIGPWGEAHGQNLQALVRWYEIQPAEHQAQYTGEPTAEECWDLAFSVPRTSGFFRAPVVDPTPTPRPSPTPSPTPPVVVTPPPPPPTPTATATPCPPACPCVSPPPVVLEWLREVAEWSGLTRMSAKRRRQADEALVAMEQYACPCSTGRLSTCLEVP